MMQRVRCLSLLLTITCQLTITRQYANAATDVPTITAKWIVIGAGPGGTSCVGQLLDEGVDSNSIVWVDKAFNVGRLGACYRNVPGNTRNLVFIDYLYHYKSFEFNTCSIEYSLFKGGHNDTCPLNGIVQPLEWVTHHLRTKVRSVQAVVNNIAHKDGIWHVHTAEHVIIAPRVVLATGSQPKDPLYQAQAHQTIIPLDAALDASTLPAHVTPTDVIAVVGSAHSAFLVLKNLCALPTAKIVHIANTPVCYALEAGRHIFYKHTGLKGLVARWAREVYENNPPPNLVKKIGEMCTLSDLAACNKIIYARGYQRSPVPGLSSELLNNYDSHTGVIAPGLFGIGIAFPELVLDASGQYEYAIGLNGFMHFAQRVVPEWIALKF